MCPEVDLKRFRHQKNIFWGSRKSIWCPKSGLKMPISVSYEVNLIILGLYSLENSLERPFFWSMSWEMCPEYDLNHFRHLRNIFLGSSKSIWGSKKGQFRWAMS